VVLAHDRSEEQSEIVGAVWTAKEAKAPRAGVHIAATACQRRMRAQADRATSTPSLKRFRCESPDRRNTGQIAQGRVGGKLGWEETLVGVAYFRHFVGAIRFARLSRGESNSRSPRAGAIPFRSSPVGAGTCDIAATLPKRNRRFALTRWWSGGDSNRRCSLASVINENIGTFSSES